MTTVVIHARQIVNVIIPIITEEVDGIFDETFDITYE